MIIRSADFVTSSTQVKSCPPPDHPEFAFIGRSNVGKSSLINMLAGRKGLAKVSTNPGKTQTINHFLINGEWYLVDLPGYGYASVSQESRYAWGAMIEEYLLQRENLFCTFVLLDSRLKPQAKDLDFIQWLGKKSRPLALILTKTDKLKRNELQKSVAEYERVLLRTWDELPPLFLSSAETRSGREDILGFIADAIKSNPEFS